MSGPTPEERRLSFGANAEHYDSYRPQYSIEGLAWLFAGATNAVRHVADVGAGTGKLTGQLCEMGYSVSAFEPDVAMLDQLVAKVPSARAVVARAEDLPLATNSVDALTVGQAWHWFDSAAAGAEFLRVVRPGGVVGVMWNDRRDVEPWLVDLRAIVGDAFLIDTQSDDRHDGLTDVFPDVQRRVFHHSVPMTRESIVGLVGTFSYVRLRDDAVEIYAAVRELLDHHPDLEGRHQIEVPYETLVYRALVP